MATPFSLTPGGANRIIIDYSSKNGLNHWKEQTAKLEEKLYERTPETFYQFINILEVRSKYYGWTNVGGIFWVKKKDHQSAQAHNLLNDFGQYKLKRFINHAIQIVDTQTRVAQDNRMLYECIMNSLSFEGKGKLNVNEKDYMVNSLPSSLCLFKVLIREIYLDYNTNSGMIRTHRRNLGTYLSQTGNEIVKFNAHVQTLIDTLTSRGRTTYDLPTNLFKAYEACLYKSFIKYVEYKKSEW